MTAIVMTTAEANALSEKIRLAAREYEQACEDAEALRRRHPEEYAAVRSGAQITPRRPTSAEGPASVVYFAQAGENGPIKIGVATDLGKRIAALQTGNPLPLHVRATFAGGLSEEAALHARLRSSRIRGEWFRPTQDVLAAIEAVS